MDVTRIAVRALITCFYLLATTRASGKKVVGQATPFDLLVALIIGDLIDDALWAEVSMASFATALASILVCDVVVKWSAHRWPWVYRLVSGTPVAVVREGREQREALRREQLGEEDLGHLLRLEGHEDPTEVSLAFLERDHHLSVMLMPEARPAQKRDRP